MRVLWFAAGVAAWAAFVTGSPARGEEPADVDEAIAIRASDQPARFLPGVVSADIAMARAAGVGWAGYDSPTRAALAGAFAEARLGSRFAIGAGATWARGNDIEPGAVRPSVVARVQLLDRARAGLDAGLALAYREDRFVGEDGFFQAVATFGLGGPRGAVVANLSYGQDGEGDDHEGELHAAALLRVGPAVHLGLDGRVRKSLDSTDPARLAHGTPSFDLLMGPAATLGVGPVAVVIEGGVSAARVARLETGGFALAAVGAAY